MSAVTGILSIALSAAPWLILGFLAAGVIQALVPREALSRWVGGEGPGAIARAAITGAPLPLCSCGAIPTALSLHREGAGRGPTTAFLISTPGVGIDSVAITYAVLGPFMVLARVVGALVTAVATGLLVATTGPAGLPAAGSRTSCCASSCDTGKTHAAAHRQAPVVRLVSGIRYAFTDLLDDISAWLLAGLLLAGLIAAFVPPQAMAGVGSGLPALLLMAVIGIPMYICATAATPIAAAMLLSGVSPGAVLVFLLAGPVTSVATLGVFRREMGNRALLAYLAGILGTTVLAGLFVDWVVTAMAVDLMSQTRAVQELLPAWLEWGALLLLLLLAVRPARRAIGRWARIIPSFS